MSNAADKKSLVVFQNQTIRRTWHNDEWFFAVVDVVAVLTDSVNPADYIKKIRHRDPVLAQGWGQIVTPLSVETAGGMQKVNCANVKGLFRIIQSIPSPKAEPFKRQYSQKKSCFVPPGFHHSVRSGRASFFVRFALAGLQLHRFHATLVASVF